MPFIRYESSGDLDKGVSNDLVNITYDGGQSTDELSSANQASLNNDSAVLTNKPVIIYKYECTVIWGGPAGAVWQYYGDDDDISAMNVWDLTSKAFQEGMRNKKFMGAGVDPNVASSATGPNFKVYTLKFKARKNPRRMRAKFGKWAVKPIVVGPHTKNTFGVSLVNLKTGADETSFDNARYYALLEIQSWQTEF